MVIDTTGRAATRRTAEAVLVVYLLFVVMMIGTVPTPLLSTYAARDGLSSVTVTVVFAVYAIAILVTLTRGGRLSDRWGRVPVIAVAAAVSLAAVGVFASGAALAPLLIGRVLSGVSVGLMTGVATAYLGDASGDRRRAALIAGLANMLGLGAGALLGGVVADRVDDPLRTPYLVMAASLVPAAMLIAVRETRPRVEIVDGGRPSGAGRSPLGPSFATAALGVFTAFAQLGIVAALTSTFVPAVLHVHSLTIVGAAVCASFGAAAVGQLSATVIGPRRGASTSRVLLAAGACGIAIGAATSTAAALGAGVIVGGLGAGGLFRSGLTTVSQQAPPDRVAGVVSMYFAAAYAGLSVPVVGIGALTLVAGLPTAAIVFSVAVIVAAIVSSPVVLARSQCAEEEG
ncbi:major facilitator family transporter [Gordonia spumicola]|uniref:Major facilitator family transporter n=2 Tax=Gordonia spumicola TaxID=589161 RepID=A0A7I9VEB9_9ACTN|nr:major facilitator family transporter [Gordonia spumicola]